VIFHSYVSVPEGNPSDLLGCNELIFLWNDKYDNHQEIAITGLVLQRVLDKCSGKKPCSIGIPSRTCW
jgi:hypothetical protein